MEKHYAKQRHGQHDFGGVSTTKRRKITMKISVDFLILKSLKEIH